MAALPDGLFFGKIGPVTDRKIESKPLNKESTFNGHSTENQAGKGDA
jgi:hypothetical protein